QPIGNRQSASDRLDRTFAALADPTRRAILSRLAAGEASVLELAEPFAMTQPAISKHLKVLERAGLVTRSRDAHRRPPRPPRAPPAARARAAPGGGGVPPRHARLGGPPVPAARRGARGTEGRGRTGAREEGRRPQMKDTAELKVTADGERAIVMSRVFDAPR